MVPIVQRNFFRMLRSGAFATNETPEPMSAFKWGMVYQLAVIHDVATPVYQGLLKHKANFFVHLTDQQWKLWERTMEELSRQKAANPDDEDEFLRADHLTNPLLNRKLQQILDDEQSDTHTRQILLAIIRTQRHIMNEGLPVRQLVELGTTLRNESARADFALLGKWLKRLRLQQVALLEGALLVELLGFDQEEIPFMAGSKAAGKDVERVAQELIELTDSRAQDFYFKQEADNIFVHTRNGSAMLGHLRRSAQYFRYFPSETVTNFFASFAHSLSHIEE